MTDGSRPHAAGEPVIPIAEAADFEGAEDLRASLGQLAGLVSDRLGCRIC